MRVTATRPLVIATAVLAAAVGGLPADTVECDDFNLALGVSPTVPACDDEVTLTVSLDLPDACWSAAPPELFPFPHAYWFLLNLTEDTSVSCATVIIPVSFSEVVGPLEAGIYEFGTQHVYHSGGDTTTCFTTTTFNVNCCDELPPPATNLRLAKLDDGETLRLTWDEIPGAEEYLLFGDIEPDVEFHSILETTAGATHGLDRPLDDWPRYFLVTARNECGAGPLR